MNKILICGLLLLNLVAAIAMADPVSVPNTFVNGETADADEVNDNFSAVVDGINATDTRVEAMESGGGLDTSKLYYKLCTDDSFCDCDARDHMVIDHRIHCPFGSWQIDSELGNEIIQNHLNITCGNALHPGGVEHPETILLTCLDIGEIKR